MGSFVRPLPERFALALLLVMSVAGCSAGHSDPAPTALPPPSTGVVSTPVEGRFTGFVNPCPAGTQQSSLKLSVSTVVNCVYGDRSRFPKIASRTTLNTPPTSQGTPEAVAEDLFRRSKKSDQKDSSTLEGRAGLGDEAYLSIDPENRLTWLVVRSANALIAVSGQVDIYGDKTHRIVELKALEPQLTELAKALLAQLK